VAKKWNVPTLPNPSSSLLIPESTQHTRQITQLSDKYNNYILGLARFKLTVHSVSGDGNCLFRSVAHQIYGDDSHHLFVREKCMDYMEVNAAFFSQFVVGGMETFHLYLHAKRTNGCWGDDPEIQAMCEIYDRSAQIWAYDNATGARCLRTFHEVTSRPNTSQVSPRSRPSSSSSGSSNAWWRMTSTSSSAPQKETIRLSYYGGGHYDSIISTTSSNPSSRRSSPGVMEDRAITRAKHRVELALSGHQDFEEAKQSSDVDATERAELELALEVSFFLVYSQLFPFLGEQDPSHTLG
jgi:OTU domain-containing protein 5